MERPYRCIICNKAFARADLLKRHNAQHSVWSSNPPSGRCPPQQSQRVIQALCEYDQPAPQSSADGTSQHQRTLLNHHQTGLSPLDEDMENWATSLDMLSNATNTNNGGSELDRMLIPDTTMSSTLHFDSEINAATLSYGEVLRDILDFSANSPVRYKPTDLDDPTGDVWDAYQGMEQDFDDFDSFSFGALPTVDDVCAAPSRGNHANASNSNPKASTFEETAVQAGSQAFLASGWTWGPTAMDSDYSEHSNLIIPPHSVGTIDLNLQPQNTASSNMKPDIRHRILSVLLNHCDKAQWVRISSSFPSDFLLDNMTQRFLASQRTETLSWFHAPSFNPQKMQDEFLLAIIAHGASLTPVASIQRFGYVVPNVLRYAIIDCILRRARWLRADHYRGIYPEAEDKGSALFLKWQSWIEQETKKRLIYRTFAFDAQISMTNHVNPLMSYSEMRVPFPEPNEMWVAQTAEEWKAQYMSWSQYIPHDQFTLADAVRVILSDGQWPKPGCTPATTLCVLYGLWGNVWEYKQLQETLTAVDLNSYHTEHDASGSMLPLRREMLVKALNLLKSKDYTVPEGFCSAAVAEPTLVLEYLYMVLYVPLQGLQAFAGRDGEQEARRVFPALQEWVQTREARQAMWHAGQVYRAAKHNPMWCTRDLRAMLVYQASIACWAYGLITDASRRSSHRMDKGQMPATRHSFKVLWIKKQISTPHIPANVDVDGTYQS
ncbi:hypothetical protein LTR84_000422 [Exophiala bonariae]|uniref:C2H2-type domain-containing protein n=1 Tax=Exophiala bonariae TaxID=1690606 RepID=A0AAV9NQG5_9EURO|nr:hypothetical protein LTR84_000422 [Exophiala bonariae]